MLNKVTFVGFRGAIDQIASPESAPAPKDSDIILGPVRHFGRHRCFRTISLNFGVVGSVVADIIPVMSLNV